MLYHQTMSPSLSRMYPGALPFAFWTYWPVIRKPPESAAASLVVTVGFTSPFASGPVMIV